MGVCTYLQAIPNFSENDMTNQVGKSSGLTAVTRIRLIDLSRPPRARGWKVERWVTMSALRSSVGLDNPVSISFAGTGPRELSMIVGLGIEDDREHQEANESLVVPFREPIEVECREREKLLDRILKT